MIARHALFVHRSAGNRRVPKIQLTLSTLSLLGLLAGPASGQAQEIRLRGDYVASLGLLTVGAGSWDVRIKPSGFSARGHGRTAGLARLFDSGHGEASATGGLRDEAPAPATFDSTVVKHDKPNVVRMRLQDGKVTDVAFEPPPRPSRKPPDPKFVPLDPGQREGVLDPISAALMANADPAGVGPGSCARSLRVFDGWMRYDLNLQFLRIEQVRTDAGYQGPVAVCAVRFQPLGGYLPERPAIKYLMGLTTMEAWLAPISGTRFLVPWRIVIPTPFGTGTLEAERFVVSQSNAP